MYKIRVIAYRNGGDKCFGITIPNEVALLHKDAFFSIESDGTSLRLISGTNYKPTDADALNYKFPQAEMRGDVPINAK